MGSIVAIVYATEEKLFWYIYLLQSFLFSVYTEILSHRPSQDSQNLRTAYPACLPSDILSIMLYFGLIKKRNGRLLELIRQVPF